MARRIKAATADPKTFTVRVTWANRAVTNHDIAPLLARAVFRPIADPRLFARVRVVDDGNAIRWRGTEADIAADKLWLDAHGEKIPFPDAVMTAEDFRKWMAENGYSLNDAAATLGLSRRQVAYYAGGDKPVPKLVFLACMAINAARRRGQRRRGPARKAA